MKISSIEPEAIPGRTRPVPKITWNNKEEESLIEQGFYPLPDENGWYDEEPPHINEEVKRFLSEVDIRHGPIEREVTRIVRLKAIDHNSPKKERKEYLYWEENWHGKNWLGVPIAPVTGHIEGYYKATTKQLELDTKTGQALRYKKGKPQLTHYIPYSKKTLDKIIEGHYSDPGVKYVHSRESIKYIVKFAAEDSPAGQMRYDTRGIFSYEQLATWTFSDLHKLHTKPWKDQDPNIGATEKTLYK